MDALDLLTYDCWMEVLLRVKAAKDLKSCSDACLTFQAILKKKKNQFMFSLILPHIVRYIPEEEEELSLKCRLICKSWCKTVDEHSEHPLVDLFENAYFFNSAEKTDQFLQTFATHSGNPFLGRKVYLPLWNPLLIAGNQVNVNAPGNPEKIFHISKLRQLLERFGSEIWTVRVEELTVNNYERLAFCKNFQTVLRHLPDLRSLVVHCRLDMGTLNVKFNQEEQNELTTYMAANPLPAFPQLVELETHGVNGMMTSMLLEKCTPTLESLVVGDPSGFPEHASRLSNLRKLEFNCVDAGTSLHGLRQLHSPLISLTLKVIQNSNNVDVWPIDTLFRNIRHLPLRELDITIDNVFLRESGPIPAEERPFHESISWIDLTLPRDSASFNFLLYCPKLEYIHMYVTPPRQGIPAGNRNGVVESVDVNDLFKQAGCDLYQSNVWENLPNLRHFWHDHYINEYPFRRMNSYQRIEYEKRKLDNGGA